MILSAPFLYYHHLTLDFNYLLIDELNNLAERFGMQLTGDVKDSNTYTFLLKKNITDGEIKDLINALDCIDFVLSSEN